MSFPFGRLHSLRDGEFSISVTQVFCGFLSRVRLVRVSPENIHHRRKDYCMAGLQLNKNIGFDGKRKYVVISMEWSSRVHTCKTGGQPSSDRFSYGECLVSLSITLKHRPLVVSYLGSQIPNCKNQNIRLGNCWPIWMHTYMSCHHPNIFPIDGITFLIVYLVPGAV